MGGRDFRLITLAHTISLTWQHIVRAKWTARKRCSQHRVATVPYSFKRANDRHNTISRLLRSAILIVTIEIIQEVQSIIRKAVDNKLWLLINERLVKHRDWILVQRRIFLWHFQKVSLTGPKMEMLQFTTLSIAISIKKWIIMIWTKLESSWVP